MQQHRAASIVNLLDRDAPLIPDQTNNTDAQLYDVFGRSFNLSIELKLGNSC